MCSYYMVLQSCYNILWMLAGQCVFVVCGCVCCLCMNAGCGLHACMCRPAPFMPNTVRDITPASSLVAGQPKEEITQFSSLVTGQNPYSAPAVGQLLHDEILVYCLA